MIHCRKYLTDIQDVCKKSFDSSSNTVLKLLPSILIFYFYEFNQKIITNKFPCQFSFQKINSAN